MGDEFRTDSLSCYGTPFPEIVTPHIDRIAAAGVRFTGCYCNSPICVPSRTSLMTATPPETNGVYGNEGSWASFPYDRDLVTLPEHLAAHGYRTLNFGKTHLPVALDPWQHDDHDGADLKTFYAGTEGHPFEDEVYTPTLKAAIAGTWPAGVEFPGERVTRHATDWLSGPEAQDGPFLARVSYLQPHSPVLPPAAYAGRYAHLPWPTGPGPDAPASAFERAFVEVLRSDALGPAEAAQVHAHYYALVAWLDDQVGRVMDALRAAGLAENTIVVVEADHGVSLGERGRLQKHTFFPEVHRVPRLVAFPGRLPAGQVRGDLCELLDLARTLCGLAGVPPAASFHGRDLFSDTPPPSHVFATVGFGEPESRALPNQVVGTWTDGIRLAAARLHPHPALPAGPDRAPQRRADPAGGRGSLPRRLRHRPDGADEPGRRPALCRRPGRAPRPAAPALRRRPRRGRRAALFRRRTRDQLSRPHPQV